MEWSLRPSCEEDAAWIAEVRAIVMRPDLERLGRYDPERVRRRFRAGFVPGWTQVIRVDGQDVGCVAVRPEPHARWIEHFYLAPPHQGKGLGTAVLRELLAADSDPRPFRLNVLQGSAAQRLYARHAFVVEHEDPIDVFMVRPERLAITAAR